MTDKIIQVSGFSIAGSSTGDSCNIDYLIVGVTESGRVVISSGDSRWTDISPPNQLQEDE